MKKLTGDEPYFPINFDGKGSIGNSTGVPEIDKHLVNIARSNKGVTIRQQFAAMAMQTILSCNDYCPEVSAETAVRYADALINELNKERDGKSI